jgi:hypothetical protein
VRPSNEIAGSSPGEPDRDRQALGLAIRLRIAGVEIVPEQVGWLLRGPPRAARGVPAASLAALRSALDVRRAQIRERWPLLRVVERAPSCAACGLPIPGRGAKAICVLCEAGYLGARRDLNLEHRLCGKCDRFVNECACRGRQ